MNKVVWLKNLIYPKDIIGFAFWFLMGIAITLVFYKPFEQPIHFDRAYLIYMSQVVFRGDPLYATTTYGYTPLGTILVGIFMKLGEVLSLNTIESARVIGILLFGSICGSFYVLCKSIFTSRIAPIVACVFFTGFGYLSILSGINAEPKLWVLFFSILGVFYFNKENWFLTGVCFSAAAMCWQVAVLSLFACMILLPWGSTRFYSNFIKLSLGVLFGTLPILVYLSITNGWMDFWFQTVVRKLTVEGKSVGESPTNWILRGIYPFFLLEPLHFIFSLIGFLFTSVLLFLNKWELTKHFRSVRIAKFLLVYTLIWAIFNSLEFQSSVDLFPLIPIVVIFCTYFIMSIKLNGLKKPTLIALGSALVVYNYFDAFLYDLPFTYSEQKQIIQDVSREHGKAFVIGFEEYYTILEKPMPTKLMRYAPYEDYLIARKENGCEEVKLFLHQGEFDQIIEINRNKRKRSYHAQKVVGTMQNIFNMKDRKWKRSECSHYLIQTLTDAKESDYFKMKMQSVPLGLYFYTEEHYSIFEIQRRTKNEGHEKMR